MELLIININFKIKDIIQYNNIAFNKNYNYLMLRNLMFGWGGITYNKLNQRFEIFNNQNLYFNKNFKWNYFISVLLSLHSLNFNIKYKSEVNVLFLDFINCYRGLRHLKSLPVRGQRTWTNAWSAYRCNNVLNIFKLEAAKKIYGNLNKNTINMLFLAEHVNFMWKTQWKKEWLEARGKRYKLLQNDHGLYKIDIVSMSKCLIDGYTKKKKITNKKKTQNKKNNFTLGFDYRFTNYYLKPNAELNDYDKNRVKLVLNDEVLKNKNLNKKKTIVKKLTKKKKKSLWD